MSHEPATPALGRRLAPVYAAAFFYNVALWVPIEKLFMTSIGFDAAGVGIMAAVYAAVVPLLETPSGILADRWSRRAVSMVALLALTVSVTLGGLSQNVATYLVAALFLGVFFAMQSGTFDSIVYDTVLEETGDSGAFERLIGRLRLVESVALVAGALAGGVIAAVTPLRVTYFLTVPFVVAAGLALLALREPRLQEADEKLPLRQQVGTTYRTILERGRLRPVVALIVLTSLLVQVMLEFGPLWMVALAAPAILYGPHWAGLTAGLGLGGVLGSRRGFTSRWVIALVGAALIACCAALVVSRSVIVVILAQLVLTLLVVALSIPLMRRMHDAIPSTIRAGVASGVSTLTWLTFLPFALAIGLVSKAAGVHTAGWLLVALAAAGAILVVVVLPGAPAEPVAAVLAAPVPAPGPVEPTFTADRFLPLDDPRWPRHWANPPAAWDELGLRRHDEDTLAQVRAAILELPSAHHRVIVMRDVEGRPPEEVCAALGLSLGDEQTLLNQARGMVRARLERHFERTTT
jgi:predicted MFS family arabinose efflux permease